MNSRMKLTDCFPINANICFFSISDPNGVIFKHNICKSFIPHIAQFTSRLSVKTGQAHGRMNLRYWFRLHLFFKVWINNLRFAFLTTLFFHKLCIINTLRMLRFLQNSPRNKFCFHCLPNTCAILRF